MSNIFAPGLPREEEQNRSPKERRPESAGGGIPDYTVSTFTVFNHILSFLTGFLAGFAVLYIFYRIIVLSLMGGIVFGIVYIFVASQSAIVKRRKKLRVQFADLLEAMSVTMRAGNPPLKALESAREDLSLIYTQNSDIIAEVDIAIGRFNNAMPLSAIFSDWAERSGLEDIASFASVYATIEGKSSRADEIVRETQQIIADKAQIEMEIDTLMTSAKTEVNMMLVMPLVILGILGTAGAGFMDAIYTTAVGRGVATGGFIVFILCFIMARKFSDIKV